MKTVLHLLPAICILATIVSTAADQPSRHAARAVVQSPDVVTLTYDTAERIHAMPQRKGVIAERFPCCALMSAPDGTHFWIGSPAATSEVVRFVATLEERRTYTFPDDFLEYEQQGDDR